MIQDLLKHEFWTILLVTCTVLGAFGGFPQPPKAFLQLTKYPIVQWFLVFVLAYQGGAGQDPLLAGAATLITFILYKVARAMEAPENDLDLLVE